MVSEKEIINALKILQNVCSEKQCYECPLRNGDNSCGIIFSNDGYSHESLQDWVIKAEDNPRVLLN